MCIAVHVFKTFLGDYSSMVLEYIWNALSVVHSIIASCSGGSCFLDLYSSHKYLIPLLNLRRCCAFMQSCDSHGKSFGCIHNFESFKVLVFRIILTLYSNEQNKQYENLAVVVLAGG